MASPFNRKAAAAMVRAVEGARPVGEQPIDAPVQDSAASPPNPEQGRALTPNLEADCSQTRSLEHRGPQTHSVTVPQAAPVSRKDSQANPNVRFASLVTYAEAEAAGAGPAAKPPDQPQQQSLPLAETDDRTEHADDDADPDGERAASDEA